MRAALSFDSAPPFAAPLRFFLTAPLFGVLAGLLLAFDGGDALASRWSPAALALTHLLTAGFMLQAMIGASIQVLPVVAGASLSRPLLVARVVHPLLSGGALLLAGGLRWGSGFALESGALLLGVGIAVFLGAAVVVFRVRSTSPTIRGLKLAYVALGVAALLGILLAFALARGWPLELVALTDLHAGWGLGGWAGVLLAAVAYVVVPMFQLTPGYPARPAWAFPLAVLGALVVWGTSATFGPPWLVRLAQVFLAASGIAFAGLTLKLQAQRRRARADATYRYWQFGLAASVLALAMVASATLFPALARHAAWAPLVGVLLIIGGFVSFIAGMLCKIVPFLAWLHLQQLARTRVPSMNQFLRDDETRRPWLAHVLAVVLLAGAALLPVLALPAGLAFALACGWLGWNLLQVVRRYRRCVATVEQGRADEGTPREPDDGAA